MRMHIEPLKPGVERTGFSGFFLFSGLGFGIYGSVPIGICILTL